MDCCACTRAFDAHSRPFLCAVDARNQLYERRIRHVELLLENDVLRKQIDGLSGGLPPHDPEQAASMLRDVKLKTDHILAAADKLRAEIQSAKDEIQARKAALAKRKSDLTSISHGLADRRAKQHKDIEKSAQMLSLRWSQNAEELAGTRAFLCKEAIKLYGLRRIKKSGGPGRYEYFLGRLPILDITTMDALSPEAISTSLAHIAHIVVLIAHYLAIRLPAEITLPHRDYPRPTIFNLVGSYQQGNLSFPIAKGSSSGTLDPKGSDHQNIPRPRPLYIEKTVNQLLKDDPSTYSFFLEAIALLAYDVAWLCRTQGSSTGEKGSLDDIFNIGRNLYNLFVSFSLQTSGPAPPQDRPRDYQGDHNTYNWVGRFSHGTMFYFLGGADGGELIKSFKLPSPMKLADQLRKRLLPEIPVADWEVLDDDEWKVEDAAAAHVGSAAAKPSPLGSPRRDSKGWMKVKSRT